MTEVTFTKPDVAVTDANHHSHAAALNTNVTVEARVHLLNAIGDKSDTRRILLKAAAGAGKSYAIKQLVADAVGAPRCLRVAVTAFQNRQLWPLTEDLGEVLGKNSVCLLVEESTTR